ncbi:hypothetical protein Tcan_00249, partial [Toxocara canis]
LDKLRPERCEKPCCLSSELFIHGNAIHCCGCRISYVAALIPHPTGRKCHTGCLKKNRREIRFSATTAQSFLHSTGAHAVGDTHPLTHFATPVVMNVLLVVSLCCYISFHVHKTRCDCRTFTVVFAGVDMNVPDSQLPCSPNKVVYPSSACSTLGSP